FGLPETPGGRDWGHYRYLRHPLCAISPQRLAVAETSAPIGRALWLRFSTKIGAPLLALKALPNTSSVRSLARATLVLLTLNGTIDAAEPNVCTVVGNPSGFDHRQLTLEGIVFGLTKSTSRSGHKQMTFLPSVAAARRQPRREPDERLLTCETAPEGRHSHSQV